MAIRPTKPWQELTTAAVRELPGQLGVFELADAEGRVVFIGFAGGRSLFGLRSEIERAGLRLGGGGTHFRYEITMQYQSRYDELLMLHRADHGALPAGNHDEHRRIGRLHPL